MTKQPDLKTILDSSATGAFNRLIELQSQGVDLTPTPFSEWSNRPTPDNPTCKKPILRALSTTFFEDGWERYTGLVKTKTLKPLLELYVAHHNTVYSYDLSAELNNSLESLMD